MKLNFYLFLIIVVTVISCREKLDINQEFDTSTAEGCGEFGVYVFNDNKYLGLAVYGDSSALNLSESEQTFNIEDMEEGDLGIIVNEYRKNNAYFSCHNFASELMQVVHRYEAISGQVTIRVNQPLVAVVDTQYHYSVDISLSNITLQHSLKDNTITLNSLEFFDVVVGDY